ncbi:MAG: hypothetical protein GY874_17090 [Desulfobacteraceae bacterium]|nr:hypothetical protein [Desulfobacteraceae bacterium]
MSTKVLILIIGAIFLMFAMMGGGFFLMWSKMNATVAQVQQANEGEQDDEEAEQEEEQEQGMGPIYKMNTLIVNLADQGGKRYLRITMEFELSTAELESEIETRMPQLRNEILMILPAKTYQQISTTEGKIKLRDELLASINSHLKTGAVKTIYFSEFVVQ